MAQQVYTFFGLGGPENRADPAFQEALAVQEQRSRDRSYQDALRQALAAQDLDRQRMEQQGAQFQQGLAAQAQESLLERAFRMSLLGREQEFAREQARQQAAGQGVMSPFDRERLAIMRQELENQTATRTGEEGFRRRTLDFQEAQARLEAEREQQAGQQAERSRLAAATRGANEANRQRALDAALRAQAREESEARRGESREERRVALGAQLEGLRGARFGREQESAESRRQLTASLMGELPAIAAAAATNPAEAERLARSLYQRAATMGVASQVAPMIQEALDPGGTGRRTWTEAFTEWGSGFAFPGAAESAQRARRERQARESFLRAILGVEPGVVDIPSPQAGPGEQALEELLRGYMRP